MQSVYESNPDALPDDAFEPGTLAHLVVGNQCRLLDPRRTPFTVIAVQPEAGTFIARINDFEDKGAVWEVEFEKIDRYQFARGSPRASRDELNIYQAAVRKFDRPLAINCATDMRSETESRIDAAKNDALRWLKRHSKFLAAGGELPDPSTRRGCELLFDDLERYMAERDLATMELAVAEQYVRNPNSGEIIKGHRIALAEMGLVPYAGKIVRKPVTFTGKWSKQCRKNHIIQRLAFLRALFDSLGKSHVALYRGVNAVGTIEPARNDTFVSAAFDLAVAQSHFNVGEENATRALFRQRVPIERLFVTYLETRAMNAHYLEAEAVLLWRAGTDLF